MKRRNIMSEKSVKVAQLAKIFKALSDNNRLAIVLSLAGGEKNATEILKSTAPFSQPTLSHHLAILCESEVLNSRKVGKSVVYSINAETVELITSTANMLAADAAPVIAQPAAEKHVVSVPKAAKKPAPKKAAPAPAVKETPKIVEPEVKEEPKPAPRRRNDDFDFFD